MLKVQNRISEEVEQSTEEDGEAAVDDFARLTEEIIDDIDSLAEKQQRFQKLLRRQLPAWCKPVDGIDRWSLLLSQRVRMLLLSRDRLIKWLG